ncbi:HCNGP-like protein-domain-containing protein [Mycena maculata]|uniref:HCNGP-like protein-domain-containing protein n=1 Tax=Mycena maculata TaxID=230809 RepID=A0AAD7MPC0_9AGAR|nr:HCNGP-like protein-domain-containing protein [Mycena maculata]
MLNGLVAYSDDSASDSESHDKPPKSKSASNGHGDANANANDLTKPPLRPIPSSDSRTAKPPKSQLIIRRPLKSRPRTVIADEILDGPREKEKQERAQVSSSGRQNAVASSSGSSSMEGGPGDELTRIRTLLQPPPIPGLDDWGIPPESTEPCDPAIQTKLAQFLALKHATPPRHFNDSLMASRAFRNPHLYANLVEFVAVDERSTNFPPSLWDPADVQDSWYADQIADAQKARADKQAQAQAPGKRSQIAFTASSKTSVAHADTARPKARERDRDKDRDKSSRFHPYGGGREKSRW